MLLIDEIERLHVLVWDKQLYPEVPIPSPAEHSSGARPGLLETLRHRLSRGSADSFPLTETASEEGSHR
jgi:hypothetical protein